MKDETQFYLIFNLNYKKSLNNSSSISTSRLIISTALPPGGGGGDPGLHHKEYAYM